MGAEARTRLGAAALLFMLVYSMQQVFARGDFAGPSLLALIAAAGIAMACRRLGISSGVTLVISGVAAMWYVLLVFETKAMFYGLPTLDALRSLASAVTRAYAHSQIDYAPVPSRVGYVAMVVLGFWIMATVMEVATFRWRRPIIAVIPPVTMFAFVLMVGTGVAAQLLVAVFLAVLLLYLGLEASYSLRSWGRWVQTWRGQRPEEPDSITGSLARRMGTACFVVALAAPVFLPSIGHGLIAWRNSVGNGTFGNGTGTFASGEVDPLVSLVPEFLDQTDMELFRVRSEAPLYWRLVTLGNFDGQKWTPLTEPATPAGNGSIVVQPAPDPSAVRYVKQTFQITGLSNQEIPAAYLPTAVDFAGDNEELRAALNFDPETGDLQMSEVPPRNLTYDVQSTVPKTSYAKMLDAVPGDPGNPIYTQLPVVDPAVKDIAEEWTKDAPTPYEKLLAIQAHLHQFEYSTTVDNSASTDYLRQFLTEIRAGYCQQFATAFAVLARILHFPARVSVGFLPGETSPAAPDEYVVHGTDAHAWPEVYFEKYGWIAFEPTPRDNVILPDYTLRSGGGTNGNLRGPENQVQNPRGGKQPDGGVFQNPRDPGSVPRRSRDAGNGGPLNARWRHVFSLLARWLAVIVLAFLLLVPLLKLMMSRRRYRAARSSRGRTSAAFFDFETEATELAAPRRRAETAVAYARRLARNHRVPRAAAVKLARLFEAAQYGPREVSAEDAGEARRLARDLKRSLWKEATWWERLVRLFSPGGLTSRLQ
ncbi:MAG TPA: DUF3488 and transglutaminase-like domain-containing protein [Actinomycetota bacterium]|nr:DUF3488 and transglutaminase-like domain-containing protein [Actinomycetota bacterium]